MLTENLVKSELSLAYIHAVASIAGFKAEPKRIDDDSVDVQIEASGHVLTGRKKGARSPILQVQLKASSVIGDGNPFAYNLPLKNYNDLRDPTRFAPGVLLVLELPPERSDAPLCGQLGLPEVRVLARSQGACSDL